MSAWRQALVLARRAYRQPAGRYEPPTLTGQAASDLIKERLLSDAPVLIARFGLVELNCLRQYLAISLPHKPFDYIRGRSPAFWWEESTLDTITQNAGFFPRDPALLERFCRQLLDDVPSIDILGSWLVDESQVPGLQATRVQLRDLEPYFHAEPWSEALAGKIVLVVHPFTESIARQYAHRADLFADPRVLPAFELKTLQAAQTIAGSPSEFATWFDAYDSMADRIAATEFDVAILGAGAYGLPLAAHVKRLGKKAIQLGGATQILFGIKGKRWDEHEFIAPLYNDHWVRPLPTERPANYLQVEDGCYW